MSDPELAAALTEMGPRVLSDLLARSDLQQLRAAATEAMQLEDGSYWDARPQIRTLALATHPRLGASSLLQLLPLGLLQQIARLLKRQRVDPRWASPSEWPLRANPYRPGTENVRPVVSQAASGIRRRFPWTSLSENCYVRG
jgi:hypothetical protein